MVLIQIVRTEVQMPVSNTTGNHHIIVIYSSEIKVEIECWQDTRSNHSLIKPKFLNFVVCRLSVCYGADRHTFYCFRK